MLPTCRLAMWMWVSGILIAALSAQGQNVSAVSIPAEHGQVWKRYDILPYVTKISNTSTPERAIQDWILLETGFDVWHSEIPAMLNVTPTTVNVYHTPEVQAQVASVIQRFVNVPPLEHQFRVQIFSVPTPGWRAKMTARMVPISSASAGTQAWNVLPEDLRSVMDVFQKTTGFQSYQGDAKIVPNGQPMRIEFSRDRSYTRNFYIRPTSGKGPQPEDALFQDGFSFELMPLVAVDGIQVDAQIKMQINHLDRFYQTAVPVPGELSGYGSRRVEVPQIAQFRFRERYQWNTKGALLISLGLTPPPVSTGESATTFTILNTTQRVETFLLIEYRRIPGGV